MMWRFEHPVVSAVFSACRNRRAHSLPTIVIVLLTMCFAVPGSARADAAVRIVLGHSTVDLNGPWKFHIGDNPAWSDPKFDDSAWETVDITAPAGAHDDDVGLTGYVPGWGARGHRGYSGYAWYRLRVTVDSPAGSLALAGPPAVDSAYQLFVDGKLSGSAGRFSGPTPMAFSVQPRIFALERRSPESAVDPTFLIAFRVWMGPWDLGDPDAGGIRIAPVIGETGAVGVRYEGQWLQTVRGYIVEVVEALAFLLLAVMVWGVRAFDRDDPAYRWLAAAMVLLALYRANQAIFFWGQFETVHAFELVSVVLLIPLYTACWTLAWRAWFRLQGTEWVRAAVAVLATVYIVAEFLTRSWFYGAIPASINATSHFLITSVRLAFIALTVIIVYLALRQRRDAWAALPAVLLISVGLYAQEVSKLGIKGIWFPFGTGVSRTQFAYAAFYLPFFFLLWRRLQSFARRSRSLAVSVIGSGGPGTRERTEQDSEGTQLPLRS